MERLKRLRARRSWRNLRRTAGAAVPVPLERVRELRASMEGEDPLWSLRPATGGLRNEFLAANLGDTLLGEWTLDAPTLNFLEEHVLASKPKRILELGSGVSTACLARYLVELMPAHEGEVVSVEQDPLQVEKTNETLRSLGLSQLASVKYSPLTKSEIGGRVVSTYSNLNELDEASFDMLLIDGPSAEPGARAATLPSVSAALRDGATFFLDDALRDGELDAARQWMEMPQVSIDGIYLFDKGLLRGRWKDHRTVLDHS